MTGQQLRILSRRARGATHALAGPISIGHGLANDVVLRDPSTRGLSATLTPLDTGMARLEVSAGQLMLLGATVAPGTATLVPPYVPLIAGELAFAWGQAESPRWAEAAALLAGAEPAGGPSGRAAPGWADRLAGRALPWGRLARRSAVVAGVLAAGAVAMVPTGAYRPSAAMQRDTAAAALAAAGYPALKVSTAPDGNVMVTGRIATDADRPAVSYALAQAGVPATLAVRSGSELARAVVDAARVNGITVTARATATGIDVHHPPMPAAAREGLRALIRREVPGLGPLRLVGDGGSTGPVPLTIADATKRVSSVVTGEPAYVVTADGAHYFAGAMLPSGHRLVAIEAGAVILEQGGQQTRLTF